MSLVDGELLLQARARRLQASTPTSYTIHKISSTYYAECNIPGGTNYEGTNAATVIQQVLDVIDSGGNLFLQRATYSLGTTQLLLSGTDQVLPNEMPIKIFSNGAVLTYSGANSALALTNDVEHVTIQGPLVIKPSGAAGIDGIELNTAQRCKIRDVTVYGYSVTDAKNAFIVRNASHWNTFINCDARNVQGGFWIDRVGANYPNAGNIIACNAHFVSTFASIEAEGWTILGGLVDTDTAAPTMLNFTDSAHRAIVLGGRYENAVGGGGGTFITVAAGVVGCKFYTVYNTGFTTVVSDAGTNTKFDNITSYVTTNSGTATIVNATTSIVVNHGCNYTPAAGDLDVHPIETLNNASFWWVDTITATQFTIHVNADPGQDVDFKWSVRKV